MADPTLLDVVKAIELEAGKANPNRDVLIELDDLRERLQSASSTLESAGVRPTPRYMVGKPGFSAAMKGEAAALNPADQVLAGVGSVPMRAWSALNEIIPPAQMGPRQTGQMGGEDWTEVGKASPLTQTGSILGNAAMYGALPARVVGGTMGALTGTPMLASRLGQAADAAITGGVTAAITEPGGLGQRAQAGAWGATAGILPAATGATQRALPQSMGGVSRPQVLGEALRRELGADADNVAATLRGPFNGPPGVQPTAAAMTGNSSLQMLETGSRVADVPSWQTFDRANANARWEALLGMAGSEPERNALRELRTKSTSGAFNEAIDAANATQQMSRAPVLRPLFDALDQLERGVNRPNPNIQTIVKYVRSQLDHPDGITPEQMDTVRKVLTGNIKTGLNDELSNAAKAARRETVGLVKGIDDALDTLSGSLYSDYLRSHALNSRQLNSMTAMNDVIQSLSKGKGNDARKVASKVPPIMGEQPGAKTLGLALDNNTYKDFGSKTVDLLLPEHRALANLIRDDIERSAAAMGSKATLGSPTASYQAARGHANSLGSILAAQAAAAAGGGIPGAVLGQFVSQTLARQGDAGAQIMGRLLRDPKMMAEVLEKAKQSIAQMNAASQVGAGAAGSLAHGGNDLLNR